MLACVQAHHRGAFVMRLEGMHFTHRTLRAFLQGGLEGGRVVFGAERRKKVPVGGNRLGDEVVDPRNGSSPPKAPRKCSTGAELR